MSRWERGPGIADEGEYPDENEINDMSVRSILTRGKRCPGRDDGTNRDSSYR
jgi:hypothetical protein